MVWLSVDVGRSTQEAARLAWQKRVGDALKSHEWKVAGHLPRGLANAEIASVIGKSEDVVKTVLRGVTQKLRPFAVQAGVSSLNRVGLAVICLKAGQVTNTPCPTPWAADLLQSLTPFEQNIVELAAQSESEKEWGWRLKTPVFSDQVQLLRVKLTPLMDEAGVGELDRAGLVEMFVRAGVVQTPSLRQRWRETVVRLVSPREREVLKYVAMGLENKAVAGRLGLSPLTVKAHLARVTSRLEPYAPMAYVVHPGNRAGVTTMALRAGLNR